MQTPFRNTTAMAPELRHESRPRQERRPCLFAKTRAHRRVVSISCEQKRCGQERNPRPQDARLRVACPAQSPLKGRVAGLLVTLRHMQVGVVLLPPESDMVHKLKIHSTRSAGVLPARSAARTAGLVYSQESSRGLRRVRSGAGFHYVGVNGRTIRDRATLDRIRALAIPPAWTEVWICPNARGHLQATGRDARGRKQYRYHARWRATRDETKFERMLEFGRALPKIRSRVASDLRRHGLSREKCWRP